MATKKTKTRTTSSKRGLTSAEFKKLCKLQSDYILYINYKLLPNDSLNSETKTLLNKIKRNLVENAGYLLKLEKQ